MRSYAPLTMLLALVIISCSTCPHPHYEGVQDTCDMALDDCLELCDENATPEYMPLKQCKYECRLEWDECMILP